MAFGSSGNVAVLRTSFTETSTTLIGTFDYEANILVDYNSVEWEDQQALSIHYAVVN